jgi:hypothetical protein
LYMQCIYKANEASNCVDLYTLYVHTCVYNVLTRIYMYLPEKLKSHRILTTWTEPDQIRDNCV